MINNSIEGYAQYYFNNGKVREEGNYKNNLRTGKWIYYYPKGKTYVLVQNQWLVVGLKIDKKNNLAEIKIASSINDTVLENRLYNILQSMNRWTTAKVNSKPIESNIYFSVLVDNNQIIILPDYFFNYT